MELNDLLLRTAFACMSCDGEIAQEEVGLIKQMSIEKHLFGNIDIDKELQVLSEEINEKGKVFLKQYLHSLSEGNMTEEQEIQIADVAIQTILADKNIEYSEIKFFKVLRSNLKNVTDEKLLECVEGMDETFLAQDIMTDNVQLYDDYFNTISFSAIDINNSFIDAN